MEVGGPDLTVVCSHGDWIPSFLMSLLGPTPISAKGGWAEIRLDDSGPVLVWLFQHFD